MAASQAAAVELFSTSILSNHKIRSRHERYISILSVKKIPYVYHDLAGDEEAKSRWRRKARDPQIPGLLVHNEWRGTFEEFEESIEFGELDLFLKIDESRTQKDAEAGLAPSLPVLTPSNSAQSNIGNGTKDEMTPKSAPRAPSHSVATLPRLAQPRAPSQTNLAPALPFAPSGSGSRKEHDAESFLNSLGISDLNLTEEELNEILDGGKDENKSLATIKATDKEASTSNGDRGLGKYPSSLGLGSSKPIVPRMYIPSADAGVKPLRLARMGDGNQRSATSTSPLRVSPSARFNASQLSSKALAAEAQASISSRSFSSMRLRDAVSKGDKLEDAFKTTRTASSTDKKENVVGREDLDDLMASLGLGDVKMSEEEADAFLLDGTIPTGLDSHGSRLGRAGSVADRARNEAAARNVARRAKEKGYGSEASRPSSTASSIDVSQLPEAVEPVKTIEEHSVVSQAETGAGSLPVEAKAEGAPIEAKEEPTNEVVASSKSGENASISEEVEESNVEATPRQKKISLPPTSNDTVLGKTSTASDTSINEERTDEDKSLKVDEVEDVEKTPEGRTENLVEEEESGEAKDLSAPDPDKVVFDVPKDEEKVSAMETSENDEIKPKDKEGSNEELNTNTDSIANAEKEEPMEAPSPTSLGESLVHVVSKDEPTPEPAEAHMTTEVPSMLTPEATTEVQAIPIPEAPQSLLLDTSLNGLREAAPIDEAPTPPGKVASPSHSKGTNSPPLANMSPTTTRRQLRSPSLTPSRRGMDVPRKISSSSLNEMASPVTRPSRTNSGLSSPPPISPVDIRSPKSATKKFFSLGRRKDRRNSGRKSEASDSGDEGASSITSPTSNDRSQKTLSMILREADEAMEELDQEDEEDDGLGWEGGNTVDDVGLGEEDGVELARKR